MVQNDSKCNHSSLFHCPNSSKCISQHRLQDSAVDCFGDVDEYYNGTCDLLLPDRFQCPSDKRCIPNRFLSDFLKHCTDGFDESLTTMCMNSFSNKCDALARHPEANEMVAFAGICDGIEQIHLTSKGNDTDETDCDEYSCVSRYTLCNGKWNCPDGADEVSCEGTVSSFHCDIHSAEFFCIQPLNNFCAPFDMANDQNINCLGSSDEREHCRKEYPLSFARRYKCE
jgi:hypothetical protein